MTYVSDCCSAPAVEGTLNTWNDYAGRRLLQEAQDYYDHPESLKRDFIVVTYGTCSECKKPSLFSEGE